MNERPSGTYEHDTIFIHELHFTFALYLGLTSSNWVFPSWNKRFSKNNIFRRLKNGNFPRKTPVYVCFERTTFRVNIHWTRQFTAKIYGRQSIIFTYGRNDAPRVHNIYTSTLNKKKLRIKNTQLVVNTSRKKITQYNKDRLNKYDFSPPPSLFLSTCWSIEWSN